MGVLDVLCTWLVRGNVLVALSVAFLKHFGACVRWDALGYKSSPATGESGRSHPGWIWNLPVSWLPSTPRYIWQQVTWLKEEWREWLRSFSRIVLTKPTWDSEWEPTGVNNVFVLPHVLMALRMLLQKESLTQGQGFMGLMGWIPGNSSQGMQSKARADVTLLLVSLTSTRAWPSGDFWGHWVIWGIKS